MNRQFDAPSLTTAVGLALDLQASTALTPGALDLSKAPREGAHACDRPLQEGAHACDHPLQKGAHACDRPLQKGAHACDRPLQEGATRARDAKSSTLLPAGDCIKIRGGNLMPN
jgi:hypothetical protein